MTVKETQEPRRESAFLSESASSQQGGNAAKTKKSALNRTATAVAILIVLTALIFTGGFLLSSMNQPQAAPSPDAGPSAPTTTPSATRVKGLDLPERIVQDPVQLDKALAAAHIPHNIQIVRLNNIDGKTVIGCAGNDQDGLPQLYQVMGEPPLMHELSAGGTGLTIDKSQMPENSKVRFLFWLKPGDSKPMPQPSIALQSDTTPPCVAPTELPSAPAK